MFGAPCPDIFVTCTLCFYNVPFSIMSHDGRGYLMHSLGKELCLLMDAAWAWTMLYGHLAGGLFSDSLDCPLGIACLMLWAWNGHG